MSVVERGAAADREREAARAARGDGEKTAVPAGAHVSGRAHLHELDMLRVVTAFGVVAVHVLAYTVIYNATQVGALLQHGVESAMHYTREVFMFTTALVLVYTYIGKRFNLTLFTRKRFIGVAVPYILWSIIYILHDAHPTAPLALLSLTGHDLIAGTASFQLYYILLTIQFYMLFPVFLWVLPRLDRHPWVVLGAAAVVQLAILWLDYAYAQRNPFASTPLGVFINTYQNSFVLMYPFYFVLGGICALHLPRIKAFTLRHGKLVASVFAAMLAVFVGAYAYRITLGHEDTVYVISVLQPLMLPYSVAVIAFVWWISVRWASAPRHARTSRQTQSTGQTHETAYEAAPSAQIAPRGSRGWRVLADATFGVYLVHPLFMYWAMDKVVPLLAKGVPEPVLVALVWTITVAGSSLLSIALMYTPVLSRLVGRAAPLPVILARPLNAVGARPREREERWLSPRRRRVTA
ncbi:MAG TPA: acyltransferase, partial [Ktedonobacterales bacterium]